MPTSDFIQSGPNVQILPSESMGQYFIRKLQEHGTKVALVQQVDGVEVSVTYSELLRHGKVVAGLLRQHGLGSGDTVMLCCGNTLEFAPIMIGTVFVGAALAPINPVFAPSDVLHMLKVNKPKIFICNAQASSSVQEALTQYNTPVEFIPMEAVNKRLKENPGVEDFYLGKVDDPDTHVAFVMCSGGTTGKPKGVELTHTDSIYRIYRRLYNPMKICTGDQEISLNTSGPFWGTCLMITTASIHQGNKLILLTPFTVESFLGVIHTYRINHISMGPDQLVAMANYPSTEKYDLSCLCTVSHGGAAVSDGMLLRFKRHFPTAFNLYGMTELGLITRYADGMPINTVGKPAEGMQIKISDIETGKPLGPHEKGEIRIKPFTLFKCYRGNPQATEEAFDFDGYVCTGDIGYFDKDGFLFVMDRLKETYKYNGIFVTTADIEAVLLEHPEVSEAAVVGIYNEEECAHSTAFVTTHPGAATTEQDLVQLVQDKLPKYKWLHGGAHFVDSLPRSSTGKLLKRDLRTSYDRQR